MAKEVAFTVEEPMSDALAQRLCRFLLERALARGSMTAQITIKKKEDGCA